MVQKVILVLLETSLMMSLVCFYENILFSLIIFKGAISNTIRLIKIRLNKLDQYKV